MKFFSTGMSIGENESFTGSRDSSIDRLQYVTCDGRIPTDVPKPDQRRDSSVPNSYTCPLTIVECPSCANAVSFVDRTLEADLNASSNTILENGYDASNDEPSTVQRNGFRNPSLYCGASTASNVINQSVDTQNSDSANLSNNSANHTNTDISNGNSSHIINNSNNLEGNDRQHITDNHATTSEEMPESHGAHVSVAVRRGVSSFSLRRISTSNPSNLMISLPNTVARSVASGIISGGLHGSLAGLGVVDTSELNNHHMVFYLCGRCVFFDSFDANAVKLHLDLNCPGQGSKLSETSELYLILRAAFFIGIVLMAFAYFIYNSI